MGPQDPEAMKPDDWRTTKPQFDCGYACTTYALASTFAYTHCAHHARAHTPTPLSNALCARYPEGQGLWSLICDMFNFKSFPNWKVVALADGCNWVRASPIFLPLRCCVQQYR